MRLLLSCLLFFVTVISYSQTKDHSDFPKTGNSIGAFIPEGYDTLMMVTGDLDRDTKPDVVMVLRHDVEEASEPGNTDSLPSRILVVLLRKGNGFVLSVASGAVIMCKYCGGIMGDPFESVEIEKGLLIVRHYGGSAWRWGSTYKFRFQNNNFFLIGKTTIYYWNVEMCENLDEFAGTEKEDINFVTGAYIKKKVSQEGCKLLLNKKGKSKIKPLIKLSKFSIEN